MTKLVTDQYQRKLANLSKSCLVVLGLLICTLTVNQAQSQSAFTQFGETEASGITFSNVAEMERHLNCLARNIYHEAGSESFEGKVAVAQVTINRATSENFPNGICQVVQQRTKINERVVCQFSWYCDPQARNRKISTERFDESMAVAKKVLLEGFKLDSVTNALYFHAVHINPGWNLRRLTRIGGHIFYSGERRPQKQLAKY